MRKLLSQIKGLFIGPNHDDKDRIYEFTMVDGTVLKNLTACELAMLKRDQDAWDRAVPGAVMEVPVAAVIVPKPFTEPLYKVSWVASEQWTEQEQMPWGAAVVFARHMVDEGWPVKLERWA